MKVKVGDRIYDGDYEPVMVILNDQDKKNIVCMPHELKKYCVYPTELWTVDEVREWMRKE